MKPFILPVLMTPASALIVAFLFLSACHNQASSVGSASTDSTSAGSAPMGSTPAAGNASDTGKPAEINPTFAHPDPRVAAGMKTIVDNYLQIKNALAADSSGEASSAAKTLYTTLTTLDTTALTPEQKVFYQQHRQNLEDNAVHIGRSSDIEHQRTHFSNMSEDLYALAKGFGGGRTLYHDHCPMYNDNKGALWISETLEIRNPYLGGKMPDCGTVEEKIN